MVDITWFLPSLEAGGAERVNLHLMNEFSKNGYTIDLLVWRRGGEFEEKIHSSIRIIEIDPIPIPGYRVSGVIPKIISYLEQVHPNVLISSMNHVNVPISLSVKFSNSNPQLVLAEHNNPKQNIENNYKNKLVYKMAKYTYRYADDIIAVSEGVATDLSQVIELPRDQIDVIYNPVVSKEIYNRSRQPPNHPWLKSEKPTILGVGNLRPQKNFNLLIESFDKISDLTQSRLLIVGEGPKRKDLEQKVEKLGLSDKIQLPGYVDNVYSYMSHSDVFVLSSLWEGLPTVLIEALACGCPVVSTDCPSGPSEILKNGEVGHLVPSENADLLAEAILSELKDPTPENVLINSAKKYNIENSYNQYKKVFSV